MCTSKAAQRSDDDVPSGAWSLHRTQGALPEVVSSVLGCSAEELSLLFVLHLP